MIEWFTMIVLAILIWLVNIRVVGNVSIKINNHKQTSLTEILMLYLVSISTAGLAGLALTALLFMGVK